MDQIPLKSKWLICAACAALLLSAGCQREDTTKDEAIAAVKEVIAPKYANHTFDAELAEDPPQDFAQQADSVWLVRSRSRSSLKLGELQTVSREGMASLDTRIGAVEGEAR